jgi:hypothetical protein
VGLFGFQPQFAKPNFGSHKLFGLCLVFVTLHQLYSPLVIELIFLPKFGFQFLSHTFCGYHTFMASHTLAW